MSDVQPPTETPNTPPTENRREGSRSAWGVKAELRKYPFLWITGFLFVAFCICFFYWDLSKDLRDAHDFYSRVPAMLLVPLVLAIVIGGVFVLHARLSARTRACATLLWWAVANVLCTCGTAFCVFAIYAIYSSPYRYDEPNNVKLFEFRLFMCVFTVLLAAFTTGSIIYMVNRWEVVRSKDA